MLLFLQKKKNISVLKRFCILTFYIYIILHIFLRIRHIYNLCDTTFELYVIKIRVYLRETKLDQTERQTDKQNA